jgi:hypothetical protein
MDVPYLPEKIGGRVGSLRSELRDAQILSLTAAE